jgi:hypothetical protein
LVKRNADLFDLHLLNATADPTGSRVRRLRAADRVPSPQNVPGAKLIGNSLQIN